MKLSFLCKFWRAIKQIFEEQLSIYEFLQTKRIHLTINANSFDSAQSTCGIL